MSIFIRLIALMAFFLLAAPMASEAATRVQADSMDASGGLYTLKGSVTIERDGMSFTSDSAVFDEKTGMVNATGNIHISSKNFEATADGANLNVQSSVGTLFNSVLLVGEEGYRISSQDIRLEGDDRFILKKATVTTCDDLPPSWCIKGRDIDVLVGERIKVRHATFRLKGIPIFYTPYLWAPIVTERRTGLLTPEFGYRSSTGTYIRQPFYWAISANRDATLTLDYHTDRAFGQALEYRYVEGPRTAGQLNLRHLRDSIMELDYYETSVVHDQRSGNFSAGLDANTVNHTDYYSRWEDTLTASASRYLDSRAEIWHDFGNVARLYVDGLYKVDLKNGVDNGTVLRRAAEAGVYFAPRTLGAGFALYGVAEAANFQRPEGYGGQRSRARAELMHSMGSALRLSQVLWYESTAYSLSNIAGMPGVEDSISTGYAGYSARAAFTAQRYFNLRGGTIRHSVEPSLNYRYVHRSGDVPLFFDELELRDDSSVASLDIMNRLRSSRGEFLTLRLSQPVDIKDGREDALPLELDLSVRKRGDAGSSANGVTNRESSIGLSASASYNHVRDSLDSAYTGITASVASLDISAGQTFDYLDDVETYVMDAGYALSSRWSVGAGMRYDQKDDEGFEEKSASLGYLSQCWALKIVYIERPEDYSVSVRASLLGLGSGGNGGNAP